MGDAKPGKRGRLRIQSRRNEADDEDDGEETIFVWPRNDVVVKEIKREH